MFLGYWLLLQSLSCAPVFGNNFIPPTCRAVALAVAGVETGMG